MAFRSISRPMVVAATFLAATAAAQEPIPSPAVTPTPLPSGVPVPLAIPSLTPRPGIDDVPTPVFVPNPRPTPTSARPNPAATPVVVPSTTPSSAPIPAPTPTPVPTDTARPPIETVILPQRAATPLWPWFLGGVALLLVLVGLLGLRRRREDWDEDVWDERVLEDEPLPDNAVRPPAFYSDRARLSVALRPTRAGLNLISATAECEVTVTNIGEVPAREVHATLRLMSARDGQDVELAAFYADTGGRSVTPMFALAAGEERRFRAVTALPHDAIHAIDAGGRPMFVPLLALSVRYRDDDGARRIGQAFALGLTQGDGAKLAPLWLDGPSRSYDNVAARPNGEPVEG